MSCIRDNKVCTKCCEVVHITKLIRKYTSQEGDVGFIKRSWKRISLRRAKQINPYMFSKKLSGKLEVLSLKRKCFFFVCKELTEKGCGIYLDRPNICRGFPYYSLTEEEYHDRRSNSVADYHSGCTVHYNIPIKMVAS